MAQTLSLRHSYFFSPAVQFRTRVRGSAVVLCSGGSTARKLLAVAPPPGKGSSKLGRDLRRIRDKIEASGEKMLTRRELECEVADRRSGNF